MSVQYLIPSGFHSDKLIAVIRGEDNSLPRMRALDHFIDSGIEERRNILVELIENENELPRFRHQALMRLFRLEGTKSEATLLSCLQKAKNEQVRTTLLHLLARIGTPRTIEVIRRNVAQSEERLTEHANFAVFFIACRHHLSGHDFVFPANEDLLDVPNKLTARILNFTPVAEKEARFIQDTVKTTFPATVLAGSSMIKTRIFNDSELIIVPDRQTAEETSPEPWLQKKRIAGLCLLKNCENNKYSVDCLIFSIPVLPMRYETHLILTRPNGDPAYAGRGVASDSAIDFSVKALQRPGAFPIHFTGKFAGSRWIDAKAAICPVIEPKKHPQKFE